MEKETVIKALECHPEEMICAIVENKRTHFVTNATVLSLINELTEEIETLEKAKYIYATVDYCADDLAEALGENKRLTEENERLKADNEALTTEIKKLLKAAWTVEADTVKKMQESIKNRLTETYGDLPHTNCFINAVDQIAKEMLEGTDERE